MVCTERETLLPEGTERLSTENGTLLHGGRDSLCTEKGNASARRSEFVLRAEERAGSRHLPLSAAQAPAPCNRILWYNIPTNRKVFLTMSDSNDFMVFSGTANLPLAEKVANYLGKPLNKIDIKHFPDGETFCQVLDPVRGKDVFVIQSGSPQPNEAYMELFVIMDALKRGSAARITAVLPYYGYARQDRKDQPRVPITARLIANLLQTAGADRVLTMDLHANQIQGFFDIPLDHLRAEPVILKYIRDQHWAKPVVVSPDTGGAKTAYGYSRKIGCGLAIVAKQRTGDSTVDAFSVVGDVKDCDVIMVDDMTATGGTLSAAAKMCRDNGAKSVHAFVSHFPLTEKGVDRLTHETQLDELVVTDSIPLRKGFDPSKLPFKLTQLSVAPLIGEAIKRTHMNESINDLFNHE